MDINTYGSNAMNHVNSYIEYCNLVGDNGGVMMSEKEYEEYKKNYSKLAENRLYTSWYNKDGLACKIVGPSSKCFCDHLYKNHDFLEGTNGKVKCKYSGCKCADFNYLPIYGSQDFKCTCKHSYQNHQINKKNCKNCPCKGFTSTWNCTCNMKYSDHTTVSEKKKEKEQKGQTVQSKNGGIVSYSSMLTGGQRFESGINEEVKKKGLKVHIQDFVISKSNELDKGQVSAWELMNKPLTWLK